MLNSFPTKSHKSKRLKNDLYHLLSNLINNFELMKPLKKIKCDLKTYYHHGLE